MSAEVADRQDSFAGDTLRLSAVQMADELTSIARYKILSELGQGAMARVYLALDPNINRKVALKVLEPRGLVGAIEMQELRTRFLLEARAAGNLRHPAAVAIYDADHDPDTGYSFIAMEWVDGQSLDHLLKAESRLPIEQAITITCQMASALDAAHQQGLIHRDVKPANILLDNEGNAKLSDFGIAKAESLELTSTGQVLGTPYFMSPEQIRDEDLDGRSDLFSLGVVLYQCMTGRLPFQADSLPALTHKILDVEPPPPRTLNPEIPEPLAATLIKALDKAPDERFQTGAQLAEALGGEILPTTSSISLTQRARQPRTESARASGTRGRSKWWSLVGTLSVVATLIALLPAVWKSAPPDKVSPEVPQEQSWIAASPPAVDAVTGAQQAIASSTLEISYTNRLKKASMDVWVDGAHVLSKPLTGPRGVLKRAVGRSVFESIPVSPGHHDVRVTIRGSAGKIEASNWTGNEFSEGKSRRLRVELIPPRFLKLSWK